jgi:hypothetical protein
MVCPVTPEWITRIAAIQWLCNDLQHVSVDGEGSCDAMS